MTSPIEPTEVELYTAGDVVTLRWRRHDPADFVAPVRVVEHNTHRTVVFLAAGSPIKGQATRDGQRLRRSTPFLERERIVGGLADDVWTHNHTLMIHEPHRLGAVWLFWAEADWSFRGYYVNLQAPLERSPVGFDTADYLLDIVATPDLAWRWKDEDEFAIAIEHELISPVLLHAVRSEGRRFIAEIEAGQWPFGHGLETWRPEPEWNVPAMPADWAEGLEFS